MANDQAAAAPSRSTALFRVGLYKEFSAAFPTSGEVVPSMGIEDLTVEHMANWLECMGTRLGTMVWLIRWPASWRPSRLGRAKFHWDAGVVEIVDRN
jgi:hypothetical protein